ncbi:MAG: bifunctional lysylphosphatidylglycerol flippase/synthetase MprF [Steroidobacteraceae bacterium]
MNISKTNKDTASMQPMTPFTQRPWFKYLLPLLSVLVLAAVLTLLHNALSGYHLRDVFRQLRELPGKTLWLAVLFAFASYVVLTGYDLLALRYVQQPLRLWRGMMAAFVAFAVGHNIGFATLSGAAIRLRLYGSVGVSAPQVALMSAFCAFTTVLGSVALIAYVLLTQAGEASVLLHLPTAALHGIAALLLVALLAYGIWVKRQRQPLMWRNWSLVLPTLPMSVAQTVVAVIDLCLAAACLYVLLPASAMVSYQAFLAVYVLSVVAVMIANVPGGLGVLESVVILALPQVPVDSLLASLLAYRVIYYLAPLVIAALMLAAHEAWLQRHRVRKVAGVARDWLSAVAPQVLGAAVLMAGGVLLLSGATPAINARLQSLSEIVPLPILELSHLFGSVAGLGLVVLSHALFRRVHLAWQLALALLLAGAVFSLLKGWDYEEALIMLSVAGLLYVAQSAFYRRAALLEAHLSVNWLLGVLMIVGVILWIGLLAHRHVSYSNELWWTFAISGDAPRMLRAALVISVLAAALVVHNWLSPGAPVAVAEDANATTQAQLIVTNTPRAVANLALLNDKRLLVHPAGDAFLMYQVSGRSWIAMGDPVVNAGLDAQVANERAYELAWSFRELSDEHGGWTVFYQVTPEFLPLYVDLGLALLKLGEEARIRLPEFTLEGSHRAEFRTARRRAEREGISFEVLMPPLDSETLQTLSVISQDWLSAKSANEKRFSVGYFTPGYVAQFPTAVVRAQGRIVAFANLWPTANREELSVDLMRYAHDAPRGVMDYLFVEVMLWGKAQGYRWFNLGMAPLSGLEQHPLAPTWHRMGNFVFDIGGHFYNFEGLRRYKEKFSPIWEPRYLAAPGGLALPRVLLDATSLIAGGLREIVSK